MKKLPFLLVFILVFLFSLPAYAQDEAAGAVAAGIFGIFSSFFFCCYGIFFLSIIGMMIFWIFMLVDVIQRPDDKFPNPTDNTKLLWLLIVLLTNWIGAIVYYFIVKKKIN